MNETQTALSILCVVMLCMGIVAAYCQAYTFILLQILAVVLGIAWGLMWLFLGEYQQLS